jgi:SAM-dependent methyltransferase
VTERFSFEVVDAVDYDELRPGYATAAIEWVAERAGLRPGSRVVDLAAGTGQLSRRFARLDVDVVVVAVEPAANMRAVLAERVPSVTVLGATAESLPFDGSSVDVVVVGNAFHHFDREAAFAELRRVLRPRGVLALFWAWPLEEEQIELPGMRQIFDTVQRSRASSEITAAYRSWADVPRTEEGFAPFERREFPLTHILPSARLADLYATSSDVASLSQRTRRQLVTRIREIARTLPETLQLPSRTVVDLCRTDV